MYYKFELKQIPVITDFHFAPLDEFVPPLTNRSNILIMVESGEAYVYISGNRYTITKSDVCFIPANTLYDIKSKLEDAPILWYIHFQVSSEIEQMSYDDAKSEIIKKFEMLNLELANRNNSVYQTDTVYLCNKNSITNTKIVSLLKKLSNQSYSLMYGLHLCSSLFSILIEASQNNISNIVSGMDIKKDVKASSKTDKAIQYISQHYSEKITLEDLCNHCNLSKTQLIRLFNTSLGTTPIKYINNFKLAKAKELLFYYPDKSISDISNQLGFDNQHYFSKMFQNKYNEAPTQYRMRKLKQL